MKIGDLAKAAGVSTQTIRYYEREGLLSEPVRAANGYRLYGQRALEALNFIIEAKAVGFTLREIKQLAGIDPDSSQSCEFLQQVVQRKMLDLDKKLSSMKRMRKKMEGLMKECKQSAASANGSCPVLLEFR